MRPLPLARAAVVADVVLGGVRLLLDRPPNQPDRSDDRQFEHDEEVEHRPAHLRASYPAREGVMRQGCDPVIRIGRRRVTRPRMAIRPAGGPSCPNLITLEALDQDGAIRETAEAAGATRADFLKRGGMAGAGFLAGGVLFSGFVSPAEAAISTSLARRRTTSGSPTTRSRSSTSSPSSTSRPTPRARSRSQSVKVFASVTGAHEPEHVKALKAVLGSRRSRSRASTSATRSRTSTSSSRPRRCSRTRAWRRTPARARTCSSGPLVKAALSIHSVEARHAAWIRYINSDGGLHPRLQRRSGAAGVRQGPEREGRAEGGHGDRLHPVASASGARWARRRTRCCGAARRRAPRSPRGSASACARGRTPRR